MGGKADQVKGRVKQAAGDIADDDDLRREGRSDEGAGKAKEVIEDVKGKAEELIDRVKEQVDDLRHRS